MPFAFGKDRHMGQAARGQRATEPMLVRVGRTVTTHTPASHANFSDSERIQEHKVKKERVNISNSCINWTKCRQG